MAEEKDDETPARRYRKAFGGFKFGHGVLVSSKDYLVTRRNNLATRVILCRTSRNRDRGSDPPSPSKLHLRVETPRCRPPTKTRIGNLRGQAHSRPHEWRGT
ncbi:hypothetical protein OSB04_un000261 [Centaurea solstitialis]|uniref:Uncharacterized protein n=1 Tax=Centaurea solstitialis TaxID=347529 RepID=A0AA38SNY9_9ASTR|nr:hypothetical protein OSB04_un000261 [Centaurea solstitialis]